VYGPRASLAASFGFRLKSFMIEPMATEEREDIGLLIRKKCLKKENIGRAHHPPSSSTRQNRPGSLYATKPGRTDGAICFAGTS